MDGTQIKIPTTIRMLRFFRRRSVSNIASSLTISVHFLIAFSLDSFSVLSAGGGLVSLIATLLLVSHSVPFDKEAFEKQLKIMNPLPSEGFSLAELPDTLTNSRENDRNVKGNIFLKAQSTYILWIVVGTLIWSYGGFLEKAFFLKLFPSFCG